MTIRATCTFCRKPITFDTRNAKAEVNLLESKGSKTAPKVYRIQCPHCDRWNRVTVSGEKP
jgi:hypothetical protein